MSEDLRFPIGPFRAPPAVAAEDRARWIEAIAALPALLRRAVAGLSEAQLDTPYRPGGWNVRQVIHHLPDSHLNAYTRFKLALTEENPEIRPYDEGGWAELSDSRDTPVEVSLVLLEALHERWVTLLRALSPEELRRTYRHPEHGRVWVLEEVLALYAWHGRHHLAHVTSVAERTGSGAAAATLV